MTHQVGGVLLRGRGLQSSMNGDNRQSRKRRLVWLDRHQCVGSLIISGSSGAGQRNNGTVLTGRRPVIDWPYRTIHRFHLLRPIALWTVTL